MHVQSSDSNIDSESLIHCCKQEYYTLLSQYHKVHIIKSHIMNKNYHIIEILLGINLRW